MMYGLRLILVGKKKHAMLTKKGEVKDDEKYL